MCAHHEHDVGNLEWEINEMRIFNSCTTVARNATVSTVNAHNAKSLLHHAASTAARYPDCFVFLRDQK